MRRVIANVRLVVWLLLALVAGQAHAGEIWLELGVGYDPFIRYPGNNPMSVMRLRHEIARCWPADTPCALEYNHHSSIPDGAPLNDRPEQTANQWSVIYRFRLH